MLILQQDEQMHLKSAQDFLNYQYKKHGTLSIVLCVILTLSATVANAVIKMDR